MIVLNVLLASLCLALFAANGRVKVMLARVRRHDRH